MKRTPVVALGLLVAPSLVSAQLEIGLDAGVVISMVDDFDDNITSGQFPAQWARVAFAAGESLLVESLIGFEYYSEGTYSENTLLLMPGLNLLLGEQFYVRGEAGLLRHAESDPGYDDSATQYGFGGAAGMRIPLGDAALFRLEFGVDRWLEDADGFVPARTNVRIGAGVSAVIH